MKTKTLPDDEQHLYLLSTFSHQQPHDFLGLHEENGQKIIRLLRPGAQEIFIEVRGEIVKTEQQDSSGLFVYHASEDLLPLEYKVFHPNGLSTHDPYVFSPKFLQSDADLFEKGVHYELYHKLGARITTHEGIEGVMFAVWAPQAKSAYLVADFNYWNGKLMPMRCLGGGVFELFVPNLGEGEKYKFEIRTQEGHVRVKSDPFAYYFEKRPKTSSIVFDVGKFCWEDEPWMKQRKNFSLHSPVNIYEVHLGSWKRQGPFRNYKDLAYDLASYVKRMGYTHIELLPVMEHPLDESWGYQISGFFAATSRYGTPEEFQFFVNHMHKEGIGVILDWVPGHFPADDSFLARFDGTALYEHEHPFKGMHPHWHTMIFDFSKPQVVNFLIANALFWLEMMHIDGLRVDAVASMLYLDYGREAGQWFPNKYGGNHNLEAIEFIKHLNSIVHQKAPGILMIAEESSAFKGVTHSLDQDGLGFDLKWNMGWMNDTLRFFSTDPYFRKYHHNNLTFGMFYAFAEKFISVLSHDEVVHEKRSLLDKMPGDEWQRFANLRLLLSYMLCMVGKKLLFMGGEIGQPREWDVKSEIEWHLLQYPMHQTLQTCVCDMNHLYLANRALWANDFDWQGFEWIDISDVNSSVISYLRKAEGNYLAIVHNFTPVYRRDYFIKLENVQEIREVFTTDDEKYGGSGKKNEQILIVRDEKNHVYGFTIHLAPLATMIFEVTFV